MDKLSIFFLLIFSSCSTLKEDCNKSLLDKIISSNKLVVGTTGDYAPFSYRNSKDSNYSGIDIQMAKNLASSLGVQVEFYQTTWKNLMTDLKENRFHLAMSGISKKLNRQQVALFSKGYVENGKMGISRCSDKGQFGTLEKIDRRNVRVIVNPGGTNEGFIKDNIKNASVSIFSDNKLIFEEIINNRADIMITDSVEVAFQAKKHRGKLCATMKVPLTIEEIAILLPRDIIWKEYIETWLYLLEKSGMKEKIFQQYIDYL